MDWWFLLYLKATQFENSFDKNLIKIHSAIIGILSFSCFVLFLGLADSGHLGTPNC